MNYYVVIPPSVQQQITEYLDERYSNNPDDYREAVSKISAALEDLARNPELGAIPRGPFERDRRLHIFDIRVSGERRYIRVTYSTDEDEDRLALTSFRHVEF